MKGTIEYLGRGLLVLALCGWAVGCGDDDDSGGDDAGIDGGAGVSGTGGGGTGGGGEDAGGGSGGSGGGVTMAECVSMTNTNTGGMAEDMCVDCVCMADIDATVACDSTCWALISCVGAKCGGDAMSGGCLTSADKCMTEFGNADVAAATALGMVITADCSTKCVSTPAGDGGTEDGGT